MIRRGRDKDILDLPMLSAREAGLIFRYGHNTFRKNFKEVLHKEIRHIRYGHGYRYLLVDVLRSAFPDAGDQTIHMMALEYIFKIDEVRRADKKEKARSKERGKDAET